LSLPEDFIDYETSLSFPYKQSAHDQLQPMLNQGRLHLPKESFHLHFAGFT